MTRYTVVWHQKAHDQLTEIWLSAEDRESVTLATHTIDLHLANDAVSKGVAVEGDLRQLTAAPLQIIFAVSADDRLARILNVVTV